MSLNFDTYVGAEMVPFIDELAGLRIRVFGEYPYLYEGNLDYERKYLNTLASSLHSYLVLARDGERVVGASTALPLSDADAAFQKPFQDAGLDVDDYYYFSESILLPEFRGQGAGRRFFAEREEQAEFLGFPKCCFCSVVRPSGHPLRPAGYRTPEGLWKKRGYQPQNEMLASYSWTDLGETSETPKTMQFWSRPSNMPW